MTNYYEQLVDVKIIKHTVNKSSFGLFSLFDTPTQQVNPDRWYAVYHKSKDKYIITDNIINSGLNGEAYEVSVIGYADNMDSIMFVVYEHQVSLGKEFTILDEINLLKKEHAVVIDNREWEWNQNKLMRKDKYIKDYGSSSAFSSSKIFGIEYYEREDDHY